MATQLISRVPEFNWKELNGKTLTIMVGQDNYDRGVEAICVMGYEESTGQYYVLHSATTYKGE